jgi:hypothetical protein
VANGTANRARAGGPRHLSAGTYLQETGMRPLKSLVRIFLCI